jgi:hypothetical protein
VTVTSTPPAVKDIARKTPSVALRRTIVAGLLVVLLLELAFSIRRQSQTFDEGFHLLGGYRYWQCGDFGTNPEHPPLVKFVAAAPVYFTLPAPIGECGKEPNTKNDTFAKGSDYYYKQGLDADSMLFRARMAAALFSLLLAITAYLFAAELFGGIAGLFALAVMVFEPNLLANGALITTDVGVSACMLATVYAMYRYGVRRSWQRLILVGLLAGLTLSCKHSGVLVLPMLILLGVVDVFLQQPGNRNEVGAELVKKAGALACIFVIATAVLWTVYGWRYSARPNGNAMSIPLTQFLLDVRAQGTHGLLVDHAIPLIAEAHLLPEAYLYGFVDVLNISNPGQPPFILGTLYPHGKWFYFPVAFVIKSTLGFLAMLAIVLFAVPWRKSGQLRQFLYLTIPPALLLGISLTSGLNIGYRHVFPMVGFLTVLIGGGASYLMAKRREWKWVLVALLVFHCVSSLRAYPNYLSYTNEAWGGPKQAYRYLTDANVDWGNGVLQLRDYLKQRNINDCWVAYDGAVDLDYYRIPCRKLAPNAGAVTEPPPMKAKGTFIISDLTWSGIEWEPGDLNPYHNFQRVKPTDVIAGGLLVYEGEFDLSGVVAASHIAQSSAKLDTNPEQAVVEAREAVALTPGSVRAHLVLGQALAKSNQVDEARAELEKALGLAYVDPAWYPIQIALARAELKKLPQ